MIIEVCAESYEYAVKAEKAGANRIELCKDLHLDGLTPDYESAKRTIDSLNIPVFILIRPREGDFIYSNEEFELMKMDIMTHEIQLYLSNYLISQIKNTGIWRIWHLYFSSTL